MKKFIVLLLPLLMSTLANAHGGFVVDLTPSDDVNDVYKVDPYNAPDDHTPYSGAGFLDITEFGVYADQESGLVSMNATFTDAPIFNATTDYFMQYSIQPDDNGEIIEIQFNFRFFNNYSFFATRQLFFANETQSNDEYDFTYEISGKTMFAEATFQYPDLFDLSDPIVGNYLVRVEALNDLDSNADTFNVEDRARFDFSVNSDGEIDEIVEEPDVAGVPVSTHAMFISLIILSIFVKKSKLNL